MAVTTGAGMPCPQAMTGEAPTDVGETTATASGTVGTHGLPTLRVLQYGPTPKRGATPPVRLTGSPALAAVSSALGGLSPGRTYHYRLATFLGPGGEVRSHAADVTFTTASPPPPKPKTLTSASRSGRCKIQAQSTARQLPWDAAPDPASCKTLRPRHHGIIARCTSSPSPVTFDLQE